jgi:hypothetical protein
VVLTEGHDGRFAVMQSCTKQTITNQSIFVTNATGWKKESGIFLGAHTNKYGNYFEECSIHQRTALEFLS